MKKRSGVALNPSNPVNDANYCFHPIVIALGSVRTFGIVHSTGQSIATFAFIRPELINTALRRYV